MLAVVHAAVPSLRKGVVVAVVLVLLLREAPLDVLLRRVLVAMVGLPLPPEERHGPGPTLLRALFSLALKLLLYPFSSMPPIPSRILQQSTRFRSTKSRRTRPATYAS